MAPIAGIRFTTGLRKNLHPRQTWRHSLRMNEPIHIQPLTDPDSTASEATLQADDGEVRKFEAEASQMRPFLNVAAAAQLDVMAAAMD